MILQASIPISKGRLGLNINLRCFTLTTDCYCDKQFKGSQTISNFVSCNITHDEATPENHDMNSRNAILKLKKKIWSTMPILFCAFRCQ